MIANYKCEIESDPSISMVFILKNGNFIREARCSVLIWPFINITKKTL